MNNEATNQFRTYDLPLASTLVAFGFSIVGVEKTPYSGRSSFIFSQTDYLSSIVQAYWADELQLNPRIYSDSIKHVKNMLYSET